MSNKAENKSAHIGFRVDVPDEFTSVFSHFYHAENNTGSPIKSRLLPSYQTLLAFNFGTSITIHPLGNAKTIEGDVLAIGPVKQAFSYVMPAGAKLLVVNFKSDAFFRFFGRAKVEGQLAINPDQLIGMPCFSLLWQTLSTLTDVNQQIHHLLAFCRPYLKDRNFIAAQLSEFDNEQLDPIKALAHIHGYTERHLQSQHHKYLGYSAKALIRYKRFLKATALIDAIHSTTGKIKWLQIVNECEYYDQSQLIRDFKHYLDLSPVQYAKQQDTICSAR